MCSTLVVAHGTRHPSCLVREVAGQDLHWWRSFGICSLSWCFCLLWSALSIVTLWVKLAAEVIQMIRCFVQFAFFIYDVLVVLHPQVNTWRLQLFRPHLEWILRGDGRCWRAALMLLDFRKCTDMRFVDHSLKVLCVIIFDSELDDQSKPKTRHFLWHFLFPHPVI